MDKRSDHPPQTRKIFAYLWLITAISGLIYLFIFSLPFPLARLYGTIPPVDYTKLTDYSARGLILYIGGVGVLFGLYIWAIRLSIFAAKERTPISFLFISSGLLALILLFSYPLTAIDLFIYAIRSRGWALYGLNPLATAPAMLPAADPWLGLAAEWSDAPSPYGPVWELLSLGLFYLSGGSFLAHLFALKILAGLLYLGCIWWIYQILPPNWAFTGSLAFAWNPLILLECSQNGHNDILMTFFLLGAIWALLHSRSRWRTGLVCLGLVLSILVKFVTIIVTPFFLIGLIASSENTTLKREERKLGGHPPSPPVLRTAFFISCARILGIGIVPKEDPRKEAERSRPSLAGLLRAGGYALLMGLAVWLAMRPLWPGWENWAILQSGAGAGRSLLALLVLGLKDYIGINRAFDYSRGLILVLFGLLYLYYLWRVIRAWPEKRQIIVASFFVLFWYVLLAAPVFHAWYLLWFLPLAPLLLPAERPLDAAIIFSITALFIIPYFETIRVWYPILLRQHFLGHLIGVPLLIGPPLLTALWPKTDSEV